MAVVSAKPKSLTLHTKELCWIVGNETSIHGLLYWYLCIILILAQKNSANGKMADHPDLPTLRCFTTIVQTSVNSVIGSSFEIGPYCCQKGYLALCTSEAADAFHTEHKTN